MYIVVSMDKLVPIELEKNQVEVWDVNKFIKRATDNDSDLQIDEGIWFNVADLPQEIYDALVINGWEAQIKITYYCFADREIPTFIPAEKVKVFGVNQYVGASQDYIESSIETPIVEQPEPVVPDTVIEQPIVEQTVETPVETTYVPEQPIVEQPQVEPTVIQQPKEIPTVSQTDQTAQINEYDRLNTLLQYDDYDLNKPKEKSSAPGKVVLFGSSKGGTGKTFTCIAEAYRYAKLHPDKKIAVADFDIVDGQVGITLNNLQPTIESYYKQYLSGRRNFMHLETNKMKPSGLLEFPYNVDFYLPPSRDIPAITNDNNFWNDVFEKLINNYDVVFFDSGIDYAGKLPISYLYKIADKIYITSTTNINSVKSIIKMCKILGGLTNNNVFSTTNGILKKIKVVLTGINPADKDINILVGNNIRKLVPIVTSFGYLDTVIKQIQWYGRWFLIDNTPGLYEPLDTIMKDIDS